MNRCDIIVFVSMYPCISGCLRIFTEHGHRDVIIYKHTYTHTCTHVHMHTDIHTERQTDRQTHRRTDRQTDRQTYIQIAGQTDTHEHIDSTEFPHTTTDSHQHYSASFTCSLARSLSLPVSLALTIYPSLNYTQRLEI